MNRKIIAGISLGLLFTAFGIISLLVVITKRHPYFVSKKLLLGALIISFSGILVGCRTSPPVTTCYDVAPNNMFEIDQADTQTGTIVINNSISDSVTGKIFERSVNEFSYVIADSTDQIIIKDNIAPLDGVFDENTEDFLIKLGNTLLPGMYNLKFFTTPKDSIKNFDWYARSYILQIKE